MSAPESGGIAAGGMHDRLRPVLATITAFTSWCYLLLLALWLTALSFLGERSVPTAVGIFAPPLLWLAPLGLLIPLALISGARRTFVLHAGAAVLVLFVYSRFHVAISRSAPKGEFVLRVMTNNVGQNNRQPITTYVDQQQPDIIALQEAQYSGGAYARVFPDRHVAGRGQFLLLSKYPIVSWAPVSELSWRGTPIAARYVLDIDGRRLAVYNVHMPTPRYDLLRLSPREFAVDVLDPSTPDAKPRVGFRSSMQERVRLGHDLIALCQKESLPMLMLGDFNMPDTGYIHGLFASAFTDAFAQTGMGYGYTFPGFTRNPISFFQPWLRLDYIFCGAQLKPLHCEVERSRPAQHRAVFATIAWPVDRDLKK